MKRNTCIHYIGYFTTVYNYGTLANYYNLYYKAQDCDFILKKHFSFFKYCPCCGAVIDKVKIVSHLYNDLAELNSRRLFK